VQISHAPGWRLKGAKTPEVPIYLAAGVYGGTRGILEPTEKRYYGWKQYDPKTPSLEIFCVFPRWGAPYILRKETSLSMYWLMQDAYLTSGLRGVARIGGEFWPVANVGRDAESGTLIGAYSSNIPGMDLAVYDLLRPGPEGALSTVRLQGLHEGSQEGQARVFLEKALEAQKGRLAVEGLDPAAAEKRLQELLDERVRTFLMYHPVLEWYPGSGWQARSEALYRAAAAVAAAQSGK
jgi:hypothetical protein